jgi:2-C-methyl-D-erythritol 4-phosphate cytidylyltransferase
MKTEPGMKTVALIAAAGKGTRMATAAPKILTEVGLRPLLGHTLKAFEQARRVDEVVVVVAEALLSTVAQNVIDALGFKKVTKIVPGGETRQESVFAGLQALDQSGELVAIHDGARPLITSQLIDLAVERAAEHGAVAVAVRPKDTIKRGDEQFLLTTLDRRMLWQMQTPQVFRRDLIQRAHDLALQRGYQGTDDASLVEALGEKVLVVEGSYENIKVTTPEDIAFVEMVLRQREDH